MAMLKHIAVSLDDIFSWCRKNNIGIAHACRTYYRNVGTLLEMQDQRGIQALTVYLLSDSVDKSAEDYLVFCNLMADFFGELQRSPSIAGRNVKISVFGKWYTLPSKAIESIKSMLEQTKGNERLFLNLCVNYDGQEEIADAFKLIAKQVELGKLDPEMVTREFIRENLYSSYFPPPEAILVYGERRISGLLLWDSVNSKIAFADKSFMEFEEKDLEKI